jgi:2,3,4,5-tetrahydropyridine-2-carboxylate N-succinyltransferase
VSDLLDDLQAGRRRAAWPDASVSGGWRVDASVKEEILGLFRTENAASSVGDTFHFRDRVSLPTLPPPDGVRVVPGGTTVRAGAHLEPNVVVMPPSYVNIGVWVGVGSMVDSHVLVGSCAQIGERVHLSAGVQVGGVLEPAGARPVIVEDDAFVGGGCGLYEGVLVGKRAVLGAGVQLTGTSRLYDLVEERVLCGTPDQPLVVPEGAVVGPGVRALAGDFARDHGLGLATAVIVKRRDARTDARTALESALR